MAVNLGDHRQITGQHGRERAPDFVFVEIAQRSLVKPKAAVFRDVATSAEMPVGTGHHHAPQARLLRKPLEQRAQLAPHGSRHGIEPTGLVQRDPGNAALDLAIDLGHSRPNATRTHRAAPAPPRWPHHHHIPMPPRIMGTHSHWPMLMPIDSRPR